MLEATFDAYRRAFYAANRINGIAAVRSGAAAAFVPTGALLGDSLISGFIETCRAECGKRFDEVGNQDDLLRGPSLPSAALFLYESSIILDE